MKSSNIWVAMLVVCLFLGPAVWAQAPTSTNQSASSDVSSPSTAIVPRLIRFSGTLLDAENRPMTGPLGVTFALYAQQTGSGALWIETQNVKPDAGGNYIVLLGSMSRDGVAPELFTTGEPRWLGVQVERQLEQPRVLLVSVPYALKAGDATTLGGLPASAFALAASNPSPSGQPSVVLPLAARAQSPAPPAPGTLRVTTAGGTVNKLAKFDTSTDITSSLIFDNGTNVGIGNTSPAAKLDVSGTVNASTSFNLGGQAFAFGSFSRQNAFLGFSGNSTTGGSTNTAIGFKALSANTTGNGNTASGFTALFSNTTGSSNTASGDGALYSNTTASENTASGHNALRNTTGLGNTASGSFALLSNTVGTGNTADGFAALQYIQGINNTGLGTFAGNPTNAQVFSGSENTFVGYESKTNTGGLSNATAIGAYAAVDESNALVLGSIHNVNGAPADTLVGIGTTFPSAKLDVVGGASPTTVARFYGNLGQNLILGVRGGESPQNVFRVNNDGRVFADGNIQFFGADFAESFAVRGDRTRYEAGDLLVIDRSGTRRMALAQHPYSQLVAGIYSTKPGLLGSVHTMFDPEIEQEVPLAVVGVVPCKVSAENGAIAPGDLLVSSSTPGFAMKGTNRKRMLGAVVGKALEPLPSGKGTIIVLVTLQ